MQRDANLMRNDGPVVFAQVKFGKGVETIVEFIEIAWNKSRYHNNNN